MHSRRPFLLGRPNITWRMTSEVRHALPSSQPRNTTRRDRNRVAEDDWTKHREAILRIYVDNSATLSQTMEQLRVQHGFTVTSVFHISLLIDAHTVLILWF